MDSATNSRKYILLGLAIFFSGLILLGSSGLLAQPTSAVPATPHVPSNTVIAPDSLASVDEALSESISASLAYQSPAQMQLNEATIVELSINPSLSEAELNDIIHLGNIIETASVQISPLTKAVLVSRNNAAFTIESLHASDEQPIDPSETTHWQWKVTANQSGTQGLILVVYRLVNFDGVHYWREVKTYNSDVTVQASVGQQIAAFDWKWLGGLIFTSILVPAFWRWVDKRDGNKKRKPAK